MDKTVTKPGVSLALAFVLLTFLAYCFRRVWLERLAYRPGLIQVPDFSVSNITAATPAQLTIAFRDRLTRMRLTSSSAAPAAPAADDFLNVLGAAQPSPGNVLGMLLGLLRAGLPRFAYEIRGVVVNGEATLPQYRVSLQITRLPGEGEQVEVNDTDLDRAIRRAADFATAAILPRTRLCRGPWATWRRYVMPGELFSAYEEACEHEAERRYDLAREMYYRALDHDPLNMLLRLRLGQLQEKLHMSLEALATYTAMIESARPAGKDLPAGLYPRRAERERTRALLIARYRRAVLLGGGFSFIRQWFGTGDERHGEREPRRDALREQLMPWLQRDPHAAVLLKSEGLRWPGEWQRMRTALAGRAETEVEDLQRDLPLAWRFLPGRPLTPRALELTRLCIRGRAQLPLAPCWMPRPSFPPMDWEKMSMLGGAERSRLRPHSRTGQRWAEHYNAACLFAIQLLRWRESGDDEYKETLAEHAVVRLGQAAACADSSFIARRRDWITVEDPDLDGLRPQPLFRAFEAQYFPSGVPVQRRPRDVEELVELRCTRDMLAAVGRGWEDVWSARASRCQSGAREEAGRWWSDERDAWRHVHKVALDHDWRARLELANATRRWHQSYGIAPVVPVFEDYDEDPLAAPDRKVDTAAEDEIRRIHGRLDAVVEMLSGRAEEFTFPGLPPGELHAFEAGPTAFTPTMRSRFCAGRAALWCGLHGSLVPAEGSAQMKFSEARLERELRQATWLWK